MGQITANAMAWAHYRLVGGTSRAILYAGLYAVGVFAIGGIILAANPENLNEIISLATKFILGAQAAVLGGVVCLVIASSIQRDITSKMLESHRLMPADPRLCIMGYSFGSSAIWLYIGLVNFLIGGMCAGIAGLPILWWVWANAVMLTFCMFSWCIISAGAFTGILVAGGLFAPFAIMLMSGGAAGAGLPGLHLLSTPVHGKTIFITQTPDSDLLFASCLGLAFQIAFSWVMIQVGARHYRSSDIPGFSGALGAALTALFALASLVAMRLPELLPRYARSEHVPATMFTCYVLLLLGGLTISSHVLQRYTEFRERTARQALLRDLGVLAAIIVSCALFLVFIPAEVRHLQEITLTLLIIFIALLTTFFAAHCVHRVTRNRAVLLIYLLAIAMVPPILASFTLDRRGSFSDTGRIIAQSSPFASIAALWGDLQFEPLALLPQLTLMFLPAMLLWRWSIRKSSASRSGSTAACPVSGL